MTRKISLGIILLSLVFVLFACAGQAPAAASQPASTPAPTATPASQSPAVTAPAPVSNPAPEPSGPIKAVEITPGVTNDTVTIPLSTVQSDWNTHFQIDSPSGKMSFMAYVLDNEIYVRASICPPCHGKTYTLNGSTLVCDVCATTFNAVTGRGIAGACVNYPKAAVQYTIAGGNITMKTSDLVTAYQTTLKFQR